MLEKCKEYRAYKQRNKRAYKNTFFSNNTIIGAICGTPSMVFVIQIPSNQPEAHEFDEYFLKTSEPTDELFFNKPFDSEMKA